MNEKTKRTNSQKEIITNTNSFNFKLNDNSSKLIQFNK